MKNAANRQQSAIGNGAIGSEKKQRRREQKKSGDERREKVTT